MSDVQNDATQPKVYHDIMDASDAILERWKDAEEPPESEELEATDETSEEETMEDESDTTEDEQEYEEA